MSSVPRLASTILLLCKAPLDGLRPCGRVAAAATPNDIEVLMVKRHAKARVMPNLYVFPGGGVDAADYTAAQSFLQSNHSSTKFGTTARLGTAELAAWASRVAALRELAEEVGCVLQKDQLITSVADWEQHQKSVPRGSNGESSSSKHSSDAGRGKLPYSCYDVDAAQQLHAVGRWVTPRFAAHRYDTYFFAAVVSGAIGRPGDGAAGIVEATRAIMSPQQLRLKEQLSEVSSAEWLRPLVALRRHEDPSDSFSLAPPTYLLLHALAAEESLKKLTQSWNAAPLPTMPAVEGGLLSKLPVALPSVEPLATCLPGGSVIEHFFLPQKYFAVPGWAIPRGRYTFPLEMYGARHHTVQLHVGESEVEAAAADQSQQVKPLNH